MAPSRRTSKRGTSLAGRATTLLSPYASVAVAAVVLRLFLGGTMLYAGIDKILLDPRFLQADGAGSIGQTLRYFVTSGGPLAALVEAVALPQPVLIGATMAGAQLLVGVSLLTGSWVRYGALLGACISLTLALTSTWGVSPYYYGNDLPYFVGFLALAALGDGGVLRLGAPARGVHDPDRRAALVSGTGIVAGIAALLVLDRTRAISAIAGGETPTPTPTPAASATATPSPTPSVPAGDTAISGASGLTAGQALNFSAGGTAAVLIKDGSTYRAFERACTHQGTSVDWQAGSGDFLCPSHGARFSATGQVTMGPANTPLRPIEVSVAADGTVTYRR
ncbi:MAG: Rieske 2Fe-2S domain-containing protein [Candidatus Limnocylindrus sp.]|jgi:thiosulfate dehydrogenase [quinone] large subunit